MLPGGTFCAAFWAVLHWKTPVGCEYAQWRRPFVAWRYFVIRTPRTERRANVHFRSGVALPEPHARSHVWLGTATLSIRSPAGQPVQQLVQEREGGCRI